MENTTITKIENFQYDKKYYIGNSSANVESVYDGCIFPAEITLNDGEYVGGGLKFTGGTDLFKYVDRCNYIREVKIDKDSDVYLIMYDDGDSEFITDKLIMGGAYPLSIDVIKYLRVKEDTNIFLENNSLLQKMVYLKDKVATTYLLEEGADLYAGNNAILKLAIYNNDIEMVELLIAHGINIKCNDNEAVKIAVMLRYYDMVDFLIDHGATAQIHIIDIFTYKLSKFKGYIHGKIWK